MLMERFIEREGEVNAFMIQSFYKDKGTEIKEFWNILGVSQWLILLFSSYLPVSLQKSVEVNNISSVSTASLRITIVKVSTTSFLLPCKPQKSDAKS